MKKVLGVVAAATLVGAAGMSQAGITGSAVALAVIGPVESVNVQHGVATVLGQTVITAAAGRLTVGEAVSVYGKINKDGSITAQSIIADGLYVPGATKIYLSGVVQKYDSATGQAVVSGIKMDLTPLMSSGTISLSKGSTIDISGTQPASNGLVLVSGITGSATTGITGSAASGITGSAANGITGSAANGITGSAANGITGSAANGITGSAANGITGSAANGITGSAANGITGSAANGITGSAANGITGSAANGITGSAANGITGSAANGITGSAANGITGSAITGITGSAAN